LDTPLYTLYGEFSKNDLVIKNGSFTKQSYGSLTMYYTDKSDCDVNAYIKRNDDSETKYSKRKYAYNSATSQFYISLSTTATTNTAYCTFATLNDDSKGTLEKLQKAIADYIQANFGDEDDAKADFVNVVEDVDVDTDDPIVGDDRNTADFSVPVEPITIKSVKITKY
jgi:cyclophilin family peptidyl-prolyl cis-trans isomerase